MTWELLTIIALWLAGGYTMVLFLAACQLYKQGWKELIFFSGFAPRALIYVIWPFIVIYFVIAVRS